MQTGIRTPSHIAATRALLTAPLARQAEAWLAQQEADPASDEAAMQASQMLILQDSLDRIAQVVSKLGTEIHFHSHIQPQRP